MIPESTLSDLVDSHVATLSATNEKKYATFFIMLSMSIVICKGLFSYRLVEIYGYVLQAGQFISPLWFLISDMIAEVYGYTLARQTIIAGFICQILFTIFSVILNHLPAPIGALQINDAYQIVFHDIWRVNIAVLVAFLIAGFINIRLITKWKFLLKGKYFWLRSIGASGASELLFSFIATFIIQLGKQDLFIIYKMAAISFLLKLIYAVVLSIPSNLAVFFLRRSEGTV